MKRTIALTVLTAAFLTAATAFAATGHSRAVTLKGTVGPGFTITLTKNGTKVRSLPAGAYSFVIADRASAHNFVLEKEHGGRFERELTDVSATGTKTVSINLTRGTWKYYCEPHESAMFGRFTVK